MIPYSRIMERSGAHETDPDAGGRRPRNQHRGHASAARPAERGVWPCRLPEGPAPITGRNLRPSRAALASSAEYPCARTQNGSSAALSSSVEPRPRACRPICSSSPAMSSLSRSSVPIRNSSRRFDPSAIRRQRNEARQWGRCALQSRANWRNCCRTAKRRDAGLGHSSFEHEDAVTQACPRGARPGGGSGTNCDKAWRSNASKRKSAVGRKLPGCWGTRVPLPSITPSGAGLAVRRPSRGTNGSFIYLRSFWLTLGLGNLAPKQQTNWPQ